MARILKESLEIVVDPLMSILMGILLMFFCILMGQKMRASRGWGRSGEGSSRGRKIGKQKRGKTLGESSQSESKLTPSLSEAQGRKEKAKTDMEKWLQIVLTKVVTCERQVLREQIVDTIVIQTLANRGLNFFFEKIEGYYKGVVCSIL